MMLTDAVIFTQNGYYNPRNDVIWADNQSGANERGGLRVVKKYLVNVMVGLGVTWYGFARPYFF